MQMVLSYLLDAAEHIVHRMNREDFNSCLWAPGPIRAPIEQRDR